MYLQSTRSCSKSTILQKTSASHVYMYAYHVHVYMYTHACVCKAYICDTTDGGDQTWKRFASRDPTIWSPSLIRSNGYILWVTGSPLDFMSDGDSVRSYEWRDIWISRSYNLIVRSYEWWGLRLHRWKLVWKFGDSRENVFDMYGDSSENLLEILTSVIIFNTTSSVCGTWVYKAPHMYICIRIT